MPESKKDKSYDKNAELPEKPSGPKLYFERIKEYLKNNRGLVQLNASQRVIEIHLEYLKKEVMDVMFDMQTSKWMVRRFNNLRLDSFSKSRSVCQSLYSVGAERLYPALSHDADRSVTLLSQNARNSVLSLRSKPNSYTTLFFLKEKNFPSVLAKSIVLFPQM